APRRMQIGSREIRLSLRSRVRGVAFVCAGFGIQRSRQELQEDQRDDNSEHHTRDDFHMRGASVAEPTRAAVRKAQKVSAPAMRTAIPEAHRGISRLATRTGHCRKSLSTCTHVSRAKK